MSETPCQHLIEPAVAQIIAAPFATGFDHMRIANEVHFKLDRCHQSIFGDSDLPIYGVGHSMGSLLHLLMATQLPVQRAGNVLMSFNNKDVLESIPFFAPFISPGAKALGPILAQVRFEPTHLSSHCFSTRESRQLDLL